MTQEKVECPLFSRRAASGIALLALLGPAIVGCSTPPSARGDLSARLASVGYTKHWQASLPLVRGDRPVAVHLLDDNLYVVTDKGNAFAIDAGSGLLRWADEIAKSEHPIQAPAHLRCAAAGPVTFVTPNGIQIRDRYTGDLVRRLTPDFTPLTAAVGDERDVYVGGDDGVLHALRWRDPLRGPLRTMWQLRVDGPVEAAPVYAVPDDLLFASVRGEVYACRAADKYPYWSFRTDDAVPAHIAVTDTSVYVASEDHSLYRLARDSGALVWRAFLPHPLRQPPWVTGDVVLQPCGRDGLYAVDADTGEMLWSKDGARAFAARHGDALALLFTSGEIQWIEAATGKRRGAVDVGGACAVASNLADDALYAVTSDGLVVCARPADTPYLTRREVAESRSRLHLPPARQDGREAAGADVIVTETDAGASDPLRSKSSVTPLERRRPAP